MKVCFVQQYAGGGTEKVMAAIADFLTEAGHSVICHSQDKDSASVINGSIRDCDIVHFWNAAPMAVYAPDEQPFGVTIHHLPLQAQNYYVGLVRQKQPTWVHVIDKFTQRQLGQFGIPSLVTYQPLKLEPAERTIKGTHIIHLGADGKREEVVAQIGALSNMPTICHNSSKAWIKREAIEQLFGIAALYVCASWEDGGPIPCAEALVRGIPVLTTPVGQMPRLIREGYNGHFFDGTPEMGAAMVERTISLELDPKEERERIELYTRAACGQFEEQLRCVLMS